ncbi:MULTISPECIES: nitroreductase family protein [unclassified Streptomyces]|uniref:Acg family FMN-binding oxidoreductase n=1 Tax=unclassified Streptomyces TaxID=2593676 RepID=UPI001BEB5E1E|nr:MULTISPECIES: nitroreductase family protein [unclassified Streptomyces]MBT2406553.1 nitroreductase [Streptomyces sp. ISL-21]MBT2608891.1 nitroreductase [Streptomyces sp. ISL-87]
MSAQPVDTAAVVSLVEDAVTAPSMHNAQPWKFVFREGDGTIELYGDSSRIMPQADPDNRALHLGCAAALFSLRLAAVHAGWQPVVRLLPDAHDPWYLAEIRLGELGSAELDLAAFHPALRRRHTSRFPFTDEEIPAAVQDGLCAEALLEGCRLALPDAWHIDEVLGLVHDSEYREATNPALRAETAGWTRTGAPGEGAPTEGIPADAFGPRQYGTSAPVRDFGAWRPVPDRESAAFERRPNIALLGTSGDTPATGVRGAQRPLRTGRPWIGARRGSGR